MAPTPVFPSPVVQWVSVPEVLDDKTLVLALYPSVLSIAFSSFMPDDLVRH
jgi:hypothetical protein